MLTARMPPLLHPQLPEGAGRLAVFIDGTESDADLAALKVRALMQRMGGGSGWFPAGLQL